MKAILILFLFVSCNMDEEVCNEHRSQCVGVWIVGILFFVGLCYLFYKEDGTGGGPPYHW